MHKGPAHHTETSWYLKNILSLHGNQVNSQTWFDATLVYIQGVTETIKKILNSPNVKVAQKPFQTLGHIFAKPKDPVTKEQRTDAIYSIPCNDCDNEYIGQTKRHDEGIRQGCRNVGFMNCNFFGYIH